MSDLNDWSVLALDDFLPDILKHWQIRLVIKIVKFHLTLLLLPYLQHRLPLS